MTTPVAPSGFRQYQNIPPINRAANDTMLENGTRVCLPVYVDPPTQLRKEVLNAIREVANQPVAAEHQPESMSGISVVSSANRKAEVESYLGMTIDNLRNVLFSRGGLEGSLILKLQAVSGISIVTEKDFTAAYKARQALVKGFPASYPFG